MSLDKKKIIHAIVVMRPADGKRLPKDAVITSENLKEFVPADEDSRYARSWFEKAGFQPGKLLGISFSIEGSLGLFEEFFKIDLIETEKGGLARSAQGEAGGARAELPLGGLPKGISGMIEAITFSDPLDFGPEKSFF